MSTTASSAADYPSTEERLDLLTIGTSRLPASALFESLSAERADMLVDVRLRNTSHLCGYTKRDDLAYLLRALCGIEYLHLPSLVAPTPAMLDAYRRGELSWEGYATQFLDLMSERRIEETVQRASLGKRTVLLCSEASPEKCHRRLVAEYLAAHWDGVCVAHLPRCR